jgi:hypothetical protein
MGGLFSPFAGQRQKPRPYPSVRAFIRKLWLWLWRRIR